MCPGHTQSSAGVSTLQSVLIALFTIKPLSVFKGGIFVMQLYWLDLCEKHNRMILTPTLILLNFESDPYHCHQILSIKTFCKTVNLFVLFSHNQFVYIMMLILICVTNFTGLLF